jgi:hypothetical protein
MTSLPKSRIFSFPKTAQSMVSNGCHSWNSPSTEPATGLTPLPPARTKHARDALELPPTDPMDQQSYDKLSNETEPSQRDPHLCLAIAVALCEQSGKTDMKDIQQDERVDKALEQITENFDGYIDALTQQRNIWPLLASGALASHLGVDDARLTATAWSALDTIRTRIQNGRQNAPHEGKPIAELLDILVETQRRTQVPCTQKCVSPRHRATCTPPQPNRTSEI